MRRLEQCADLVARLGFVPIERREVEQGVLSREDIASVLREVDRPLHVLAGSRRLGMSVDELASMGVRRISVGGLCAGWHTAH